MSSNFKAFGGSQLLLEAHSKYARHSETFEQADWENAIWEWKNECGNSFQLLKQRLSESPVLSMYDPDIPLKIDCDASKYGLGALLSHKYPDGT